MFSTIYHLEPSPPFSGDVYLNASLNADIIALKIINTKSSGSSEIIKLTNMFASPLISMFIVSCAYTLLAPTIVPTHNVITANIVGRYGFILENIVEILWIFDIAIPRKALKSAEITPITKKTGINWLMIGTIMLRSIAADVVVAVVVVVVVVTVAFSSCAKTTAIEAKADRIDRSLTRIVVATSLDLSPVSECAEQHAKYCN